jgi:hypothetical protein
MAKFKPVFLEFNPREGKESLPEVSSLRQA